MVISLTVNSDTLEDMKNLTYLESSQERQEYKEEILLKNINSV